MENIDTTTEEIEHIKEDKTHDDIGQFVPICNGKYHTLVSLQDLPKIAGYTLFVTNGYASIKHERKSIRLSHFLLKKPKSGCVIDHINNNTLDNRRSNLREATNSQNSQNRKKQQETYTSNYLGVFWDKTGQKWIASSSKNGKNYRGNFTTEIKAAKFYDKIAIYQFGMGAKTNNTLTKEEIETSLTTPPPKPCKKRKRLDLKNGVYYIEQQTKKYSVRVYYAGKLHFGGNHLTEEAANEKAKTLLETLKLEDAKKPAEIIPRNEDGFVYIIAASKKLGPTKALVNERYYREINQHAWYITHSGYVAARIDGRIWRLHRWIWTKINGDIPNDKVVDHINHVRTDSRMENLRLLTISENNHNQKKQSGTYSQYLGISWCEQRQKWIASVTYYARKIFFGYFATEEDAYQAYCDEVKKYYPSVHNSKATSVSI